MFGRTTKQLAVIGALLALGGTLLAEDATISLQNLKEWSPKFTLETGVGYGAYSRGVVWDTNWNYSMGVNVELIDGLNLKIAGRIPLSDSKMKGNQAHEHVKEIKKVGCRSDQLWKPHGVPMDGEDLRDGWEFDQTSVSLSYNRTLSETSLGNITLAIAYRYTHEANIYSEYSSWGYIANWGYWIMDSSGRHPDPRRNDFTQKHGTVIGEYNFKWRDQDRHEFSLGASLDDVFLTPNGSFTIDAEGKYWVQLGVKYSKNLDFISDKLTFNTTLDAYIFGKNYFQSEVKWKKVYADPQGDGSVTPSDITQNKQEYANDYTIDSDFGLKTIVWRSSFDYQVNDKLVLSPYVTLVSRVDDLADEDYVFSYVDDNEILCGIDLKYTF